MPKLTRDERDELAELRERCKPTEPPYWPCLRHATTDDTCSWCLRYALAAEEELRRQQHRAHHAVMDSQQREIVALRAETERLRGKLAQITAAVGTEGGKCINCDLVRILARVALTGE